MKKTLLIVFSCIVALGLSAQTVNNQYQDGKIWFKVNKDQMITSSQYKQDPGNLSKNTFPFLAAIEANAGIKQLSSPFQGVKNAETLEGVYLLQVNDPYKVDYIVEELLSNPAIEYAERVPLDMPMLAPPPNDTYYNSQWELAKVNAPGAWLFSAGSSAVVVAVIDDAIQARTTPHPDLNLWVNTPEISGTTGVDDDKNGYIDDKYGFDATYTIGSNIDFVDPPNNNYTHGTQVAGVVAAKTNNGIGVACLGNGIKVMPVKATNAPNTITNGYEGIIYAAASGAKVICIPWGSPISSVTGQNIINYAHSRGCVLVAAAGNNNSNTMFYPAAYNHVIAVGALQSNNVKAAFSNYGSWVDICAPGVNIYTTAINSGYGTVAGTSVAAGMVAGLAGLMLSYRPGMTPAEVENCIKTKAISVDAENPSYAGLLGNGIIDANEAMGCINPSQYSIPVADFEGNVTTIYQGGKVVFKNKSLHNPNYYTWKFEGGNPASSSSADNVEVTYTTPGVYTVTLTSGNSFGSNTKVKTAYINVIAGGTCDTLNWQNSKSWTGTIYTSVSYPLFILGPNSTNQMEKAQTFDLADPSKDKLIKVWIRFGNANVTSGTAAGKYIRVKVFSNSMTNNPDQELASVIVPFQTIIDDVAGNLYTEVVFPTPVQLTPSFYISLAMTGDPANGGNLDWDTDRDTLAVVSNTVGQSSSCMVYKKDPVDGAWCRADLDCGPNKVFYPGFDISMYVFPFVTDQPVNATFTQSSSTVCEGNSVIFDASGSTYQDSISWSFPGGQPSKSNKLIDTILYVNQGPNAQYTNPVTLIVSGGGCIMKDTLVKTITVYSSPNISVTSNPLSICTGAGATVTATASSSLSSSFTWSPATGLSATTGATVIITPTSTQTYEVLATSNGCKGTTYLTIPTDSTPVAITVVDTVACVGEVVTLDGSLSKHGETYAWTVTGGIPSSGTTPSMQTTFTSAGKYVYSLLVNNSCGFSSTSDTIRIGCDGVDELFSSINVKGYYNSPNHTIELNVYMDKPLLNKASINLINYLGQIVKTESVQFFKGANTYSIDVRHLAKGAYSLQLTDNNSSFVQKLMIY